MFLIFFLLFEGRIWDLIVSVPDHCLSFYFEFYVTLVDGRFPVKMLIFTVGVIIKTFPQRKHCTLALECQEFV